MTADGDHAAYAQSDPTGQDTWWDDEADEPVLGVVPVEGRGSLPFALVHGESLLAAASWAVTTAGARLFDLSVAWEQVREAGLPLLVHDPLCPLTPVGFLAEAVEECRRTGAVVVGCRPVTDTLKQVVGEEPDGTLRLGPTVDRDGVVVVASPLVLPAAVVAALDSPRLDDLSALVTELAARYPVRQLLAPPLGRRIATTDELEVLAALSAVTAQESRGEVSPDAG